MSFGPDGIQSGSLNRVVCIVFRSFLRVLFLVGCGAAVRGLAGDCSAGCVNGEYG